MPERCPKFPISFGRIRTYSSAAVCAGRDHAASGVGRLGDLIAPDYSAWPCGILGEWPIRR